MLNCPDSVAAALLSEGSGQTAPEVVARFVDAMF